MVNNQDSTRDDARNQALAQIASIEAMIAAYDVDYDRLEDLETQCATCRSVSHGTMRRQDLIPAFLAALREEDSDAYAQCLHVIPAYVQDEGDSSEWWQSDDSQFLLESLTESLEDCASSDMYFGAHTGDGSDFGFWLTEEADSELQDLRDSAGGCKDQDDAETRILEDALCVEYRSEWVSPGEEMTPSEFRILLCTGGPHVEILGEIDHKGEPARCWIVYKDWGTSGELTGADFDHATVLRYCGFFVSGE